VPDQNMQVTKKPQVNRKFPSTLANKADHPAELTDLVDDNLRRERASNDSTWGEGAASAFENLQTKELNRAKARPSDDHPSRH
jgi:hypothetical protein